MTFASYRGPFTLLSAAEIEAEAAARAQPL